jgi:superfamily II DNA helicase RecQ
VATLHKATAPHDLLQEATQAGYVSCVAVDEAHCASEWGHEFRPSYLQLADLRKSGQPLHHVPFIALTATCTDSVRGHIISALGLQAPVELRSSFNRPNIRYAVRCKEALPLTRQEDESVASAEMRAVAQVGTWALDIRPHVVCL